MDENKRPFELNEPQQLTRRGRPLLIPSSLKAIAERAQVGNRLQQQLLPISGRVRRMTEAQRRAFFVKLTHSRTPDLTGTGLKQISPVDPHVTLAVLRDPNLDRLNTKIESYTSGEMSRTGVIPNQSLVSPLESIEEGQPLDRVSDEIFSQYANLIELAFVNIEVEITASVTGVRQQRVEFDDALNTLDRELGNGARGNIFEHEESAGVCRVILRCSGAALKELVEAEQWQTVITWIELQTQYQTFTEILREFTVGSLGAFESPDEDAPIVCVVDSGVTPGNAFLTPVVRDDLVRTFVNNEDGYDGYGHGSGVASLAAYYTLALAPGANNVGKVWIASAKILDRQNNLNERLLGLVLKEVVATFKPLGVKIFNLSVNCRNRPWNSSTRRIYPKRSWTARAIDELSAAEDVLFVVSSGNILTNSIWTLHNTSAYPRYLAQELTTILDPAQAALAISVGSLAATAHVEGAAFRAVALRDQPSPFTRTGPGIRAEIKPEVVEYGGNVVIDEGLKAIRENRGCSVVVASKLISPAIAHTTGTSLAAPRVSHQAALIQRTLRGFGIEATATLLKAFLIHSARLPQSNEFQSVIGEIEDSGQDIYNIVGHGVADAARATYVDDYTSVMYYDGELSHNKVAIFDIPVPIELVATRERKVLSVCLSFHPEVHKRGFGDYFGTTMQWRMFRGDISREAIVNAMSVPLETPDAGDDDDVNRAHPEMPQELKGVYGIQRRSRGALQYDKLIWSEHRDEFSEGPYILALTSFERWKRSNPRPIQYSVVVRLEETSQTIPISDLIAVALGVPVEIPVPA